MVTSFGETVIHVYDQLNKSVLILSKVGGGATNVHVRPLWIRQVTLKENQYVDRNDIILRFYSYHFYFFWFNYITYERIISGYLKTFSAV